MTKTKIVALLSVLALLASLPMAVALAQGAPYLVIGTAMLDDEPAMMGTMVVAMTGEGEEAMKVGEGEVFNEMGQYRLLIEGGDHGDTVMISLMMGEGEEAMEYMAMTDDDVMIGSAGDSMMVDLMAYSGDAPDPTPTPRPTISPDQDLNNRVNSAVRAAVARIEVPAGETGPSGADGADGAERRSRPAGADGADGADGAAGARGPAVQMAQTAQTDATAPTALPVPLTRWSCRPRRRGRRHRSCRPRRPCWC